MADDRAMSVIEDAVKSLGDFALPSIMVLKHRILGGKPMRFNDSSDPWANRPWQIAPLDDAAKTVVIVKARQLGLTEIMITKALYLALLTRCVVVYTMPKWDKAKEIARERINPLGMEWSASRFSDTIIKRFTNWDSLLFKHLRPIFGGGQSSLLVNSAWKESGESSGESTAADALFYDEYDRMNPQVEAAFSESISSSKIGLTIKFSTPTYPNHGIDLEYQKSDKKRYLYRCQSCNEWQALNRDNIKQLSGPKDLIERLERHDELAQFPQGTFEICCVRCSKPIDRMMTKAQWVAERNIREISGYHVSQLNAAHISADQIMSKLRDRKPGLAPFYWYVLGEAYLGEGGRLDKGFLYSLVDPSIPVYSDGETVKMQIPDIRIAMGIDWGKTNWYVIKARIPGHQYPVVLNAGYVYDTDDPEDAGHAMVKIGRQWDVHAVVADFGYGMDRNPVLYKEFGYRFYACQYTGQFNTTKPTFSKNPPSIQKPLPITKVDRDSTLKCLLADARFQRFSIAPLPEAILDIMDNHFRGIVIRSFENEDGELEEEAVKISDDHFLHAMNYADVALELIKRTDFGIFNLDGSGVEAKKLSAVQRVIKEQGLDKIITGEEVMEQAHIMDMYGFGVSGPFDAFGDDDPWR